MLTNPALFSRIMYGFMVGGPGEKSGSFARVQFGMGLGVAGGFSIFNLLFSIRVRREKRKT